MTTNQEMVDKFRRQKKAGNTKMLSVCGYPVVSGSVVPWSETYEQKGQAERRAANKSAPMTNSTLPPGRTQGKGISTHDNDCLNNHSNPKITPSAEGGTTQPTATDMPNTMCTIRELGNKRLYELGEISKTVQCQAGLKYAPEGLHWPCGVCLMPSPEQ